MACELLSQVYMRAGSRSGLPRTGTCREYQRQERQHVELVGDQRKDAEQAYAELSGASSASPQRHASPDAPLRGFE